MSIPISTAASPESKISRCLEAHRLAWLQRGALEREYAAVQGLTDQTRDVLYDALEDQLRQNAESALTQLPSVVDEANVASYSARVLELLGEHLPILEGGFMIVDTDEPQIEALVPVDIGEGDPNSMHHVLPYRLEQYEGNHKVVVFSVVFEQQQNSEWHVYDCEIIP